MGIYDEPLAIVTGVYPSAAEPQAGTFVHQLADALVREGARPTIVAPRPIRPSRQIEVPPSRAAVASSPAELEVVRPAFLPFSNRVLPGGFSTFRWTVASFARSVVHTVLRSGPRPICCYGHFLYPAGYAALRTAERIGVPAVVALGESSLAYYDTHLGRDRVRRDLDRFDGILSVSHENVRHCVETWGISESKIVMVPNAVDIRHFHPLDRRQVREQLGLPRDRFIVAFVGHFTERKGPLRVLAALQSMPDVGAVFLGDGPQRPAGPQVLFAGPVEHSLVPAWLSAADVFVLPTLAEGSPNAVIEAMACGLPIISSDRPFAREILDRDTALLVEPLDVTALAGAVRALRDDTGRRLSVGEAALRRARGFTIQQRAKKILDWLNAIIDRRLGARR